MEQTTPKQSPTPSPYGTFDAMSLAPVHDAPTLTISPTTLQFSQTPSIKVEPPAPEVQDSKEKKPEEKKPVKKRKSWGQELPIPKTNLPPRKRAKTEDEKEQRRIERVLRNRAAAQTSRERKRLEVEKLENEKKAMEEQNTFLLKRLSQMEAENNRLSQQIAHLSGDRASSRSTTPLSAISTTSPLVSGSPTFTQTLFKQEQSEPSFEKIPFASPVSLCLESPEPELSDLTQHPAAVLCDLQCQSETSKFQSSQTSLALRIVIHHLFQMMTLAAFSTVILPTSQIFHSLKEGTPLTFSQAEISQHFPLILWLITTTSLSKVASTRRSVFRTRLLSRLLECSPALARPLKDATSKALQQALAEARSQTASTGAPGAQDWRSLMIMRLAIDRIEQRSALYKRTRRIESLSARARYIQGYGSPAKQILFKRGRSSGRRATD